MSDADLNVAAAGAIDGQHPWLGLDSFTEQTRAYFFGRDEEVAELARRIQRKTLTILFGQSGLGKTSILRAGLVPQLRPQGYCPVYVRISYAEESPSPAEQIKQAILRATTAQGHWSRAGVSQAGETLWEFLHHRDDSLRDESGAPLTPLLIFDQFEEIFTLAQTDDAGKRRVARFVEELADLVESRPPAALEARMELDDTLSARFDFARDDYRVLISLREDYLAHLEGLRGAMPSITQNRMRLARMNGRQALAAVTKRGGRLVSEEVAQAIVRFIAGGAELANAEVEPSLLSLICRELNSQRIAQKRAEISTDLLAGSHAGILAEFYERALSDMPEGVHRVIEDDLLTEAGYRENLAEERVLKVFAAAGAPPGALAVLVNRRLLRIEERLDVRRVELTHDVLCGVVLAARAQRHERQARETAERQLQQQALEQRQSRKALLRARQVAAGCVALAVLAVAGGLYGYVKARDAEKTRGEAEALVGYLLDDFYVKLKPSGHVDLIGDLVDRAADYYQGLPAGMRNAGTERNRAVVLLRRGQVLHDKGQFKAAEASLDEAIALLRRAGKSDRLGRSVPALSEALFMRASAAYGEGQAEDALRFATQAVAVIRPAATAPDASHAVLLPYASALRALAFYQSREGAVNASLLNLRAAQHALAYAAHGDQDTAATLLYIRTLLTLHGVLTQLSTRHDEAAAIDTEGLAVIDRVLTKEPANYAVINAKARLLFGKAGVELQDRRPSQAIETLRRSMAALEDMRRLDPSQTDATANISITHEFLARGYSRLGQVSESEAQTRQAYGVFDAVAPSVFQMGNLWNTAMDSAKLQANIGDREGVRDAMRLAKKFSEGNLRNEPGQSPDRMAYALHLDVAAADNDRVLGDVGAVTLDRCAALVSRAESLPGQPKAEFDLDGVGHDTFILDAQVAYARGDYVRAVASAERARQERARSSAGTAPPDPDSFIVQALALGRLDRAAEAQALILPLIHDERRLIASGADDQFLRIELASSLLASALSDPSTRQASLREARQLLDALPATIRSFNTVKLWRARIQEAQSGHG